MNSKKEKKAWREVKYREKFSNAFRGIYVAFKITKHSFIYIAAILFIAVLGFYFRISSVEWVLLAFAVGFVIVSEMFNTAIEIDMDLTSPEYHPYARDTKDTAAGAVLISALVSIIVGLIIFLPKIFLN